MREQMCFPTSHLSVFADQKIQTNDLERIEVVTGDNVLITVDATVAWRIEDVEAAAVAAVKTMQLDGSEIRGGEDIIKLRSETPQET